MQPRSGFTLIEMLIVGAIVISLAAVVYPLVAQAGDASHEVAAATAVHQIRQQIELHRAIRDVPMSPEGFPMVIEGQWFLGGRLPSDPWTMKPLAVQVVHGPTTAISPNEVTFQIAGGQLEGNTAWYNASNGTFCLKVPDRGAEADIRGSFERVNERGGLPSMSPKKSGAQGDGRKDKGNKDKGNKDKGNKDKGNKDKGNKDKSGGKDKDGDQGGSQPHGRGGH